MMGKNDDGVLFVSDAGYGFLAPFSALVSRGKSGKAVVTLPAGVTALKPVIIPKEKLDQASLKIALIAKSGRMLVCDFEQVPNLNRGKGVKLFQVPKNSFESGEESVVAVAAVSADEKLLIEAGKRTLTLSQDELVHYQGERGRRGTMLPRGFQKVKQAYATA